MYYDKQADLRDRYRAEEILQSEVMYSNYTEAHLRNALRFAKGCGGNEAKARVKMIQREQNRRRS